MRRKFAIFGLALAGVALATPASAEELGGGFGVSGDATIVSDYRFRGISQSNRRFAVQGSLTISHDSGFYASVWGSSIDDYVANGSDVELDLIFGYSREFGDTTIDVGVLYYYFPDSGGIASDFIEPYASISHAFGPVTATASIAYAPSQAALDIGAGDEDNLYIAGDLEYAIPETPVTLTAHIGHSFGPSYLTIGDEYTDWSLGASVAIGSFTVGISYVDTDGTVILPSGRNASKAGVVASVGVSF